MALVDPAQIKHNNRSCFTIFQASQNKLISATKPAKLAGIANKLSGKSVKAERKLILHRAASVNVTKQAARKKP